MLLRSATTLVALAAAVGLALAQDGTQPAAGAAAPAAGQAAAGAAAPDGSGNPAVASNEDGKYSTLR